MTVAKSVWHKRKATDLVDRVKTKAFIIVFFVAVGAGFYVLVMPHPPKEGALIEKFYAHRPAYEKLRVMFQADGQVNRIASYGVAVTNSVARFSVAKKPAEVGFPLDRYTEYLALLQEAGASLVSRREWEQSSDPIFLVWRWGWGGHTKHIGICWKAQAPTNQMAGVHQKRALYTHIDGNWYLWRD